MAATDKVSGIDGTCVHNSVTIPITAWTLDITSDTKDVTDSSSVSGSAAWSEKLPSGIKSWSGTFEGFIIDGTAGIVPGGAAATLTLTAETGFTFAGSVIITGRSVNLSVVGGDAAKHTYTFEGTSTLTETNS